jgi:isoleucyl-tRNA synthetase
VAQGYEDVKDPSVFVKFRIKDSQGYDGYSFLVWTTTPWTLISNVALCVGADISYSKIKLRDSEDKLILATDRLCVIKGEYEILGELKGSELEGILYERLFDYMTTDSKAYYVTLGEFVSTSDGSGIVHIAPAFGEDDYQLSLKYGLPVVQPVDSAGRFTDEITDFAGRFVKEADDDIISMLKQKGKLYYKEKFIHSYPHCWRCHSPLLYYARESWYINTTSYKDEMIRLNKEINWYPSETGSGRFGNWLEENRDWALSRDRYWGTPLPIWHCNCEKCDQKYIAIGSINELKHKAVNFNYVYKSDDSIDLHKPYIDRIKLKCEKCGCEMSRVEEVIDAWYDSGSMPFAQYHYPFENCELFESRFPADFIAEGIDQTRGWFYSLHAISTFLFRDKAFRNLIVNDLILDKNGQKMSKHVGNVVDPFVIMDKYGADLLRWYLISSSPPWRPKMFNEDELIEIRNRFFDTVVNTYRFFSLYCNLTGTGRDEILGNFIPYHKRPEIDMWIISLLNSVRQRYINYMDSYDITKAARMLSDFVVDDLSNWYVRRNRKRFRSPENQNDKYSAYGTLYEVLVETLKMMSPFSPFITEKLYRELTGEESVHLSDLKEPEKIFRDVRLEESMNLAQQIVYLVRSMRVRLGLKTKQPLRKLLLTVPPEHVASVIATKDVVLEEVNIREMEIADDSSPIIKRRAKVNFRTAGPKYGSEIKKFQTIVNELDNTDINELIKNGRIKKGELEIEIDDVLIYTQDIEGWVIESSGYITAAIDTQLDNELISEGIAREFISKIQSIRKNRNMNVNDKISIKVCTDENLREMLQLKKDYIAQHILASEFLFSETENINGAEEIRINDRTCRVSVRRIN